MSDNSQFNNIGDQIKNVLNDAIITGDYEKLKSVISDTVTSALDEAGAVSSKAWQQKEMWKRQQEEWKRQQEVKAEQQRAERIRQERMAAARQKEEARRKSEMLQQQRSKKTELLAEVKSKGLVPGILYIVFGSIACIPLAILSIIGLACGWSTVGYLLFFLGISILSIFCGKNKITLIEKAKRYVRLCGSKMYADVEELATQVGVSSKKVTRDLRKILQKGIIPTAHIDKKGTHLMLNDVVYKQYMDAEKARLIREKEEKQSKEQVKVKKAEKPVAEKKVSQKTELEQMIEEGQDCIQKLRNMNDLIPGEVISSKLYHLENLLKEIFQRLQKEPAQMNRMHKVMNYYLPTTLKLVEAYHEFDIISNPNDEIVSAKKEIEETIDTINDAFEELLNSLFQDKVLDITTDAQVLQTMLANEGLTKEMEFVKVNSASSESENGMMQKINMFN